MHFFYVITTINKFKTYYYGLAISIAFRNYVSLSDVLLLCVFPTAQYVSMLQDMKKAFITHSSLEA